MAKKLKGWNSRELIALIKKDDWYLVSTRGDHQQFKHPVKKGRVTITHPRKDIPAGTAKSIFKQAGIDPEDSR